MRRPRSIATGVVIPIVEGASLTNFVGYVLWCLWLIAMSVVLWRAPAAVPAAAQPSSFARSFRSIVTLRLVLPCSPTRFHVAFFSVVSVDRPRIRQWTSRPSTTRVSKSFEAASRAFGGWRPAAPPSGT